MDDDTTPDFLAQWQERREQELAESVQRIQENLLPVEPRQWEIQKAEYQELWDDYCDAKRALQVIANLDPDKADFAVGLASAALEELECK